jgi:hypothetical protein
VRVCSTTSSSDSSSSNFGSSMRSHSNCTCVQIWWLCSSGCKQALLASLPLWATCMCSMLFVRTRAVRMHHNTMSLPCRHCTRIHRPPLCQGMLGTACSPIWAGHNMLGRYQKCIAPGLGKQLLKHLRGVLAFSQPQSCIIHISTCTRCLCGWHLQKRAMWSIAEVIESVAAVVVFWDRRCDRVCFRILSCLLATCVRVMQWIGQGCRCGPH